MCCVDAEEGVVPNPTQLHEIHLVQNLVFAIYMYIYVHKHVWNTVHAVI